MWTRLIAVADEAAATLVRTSFSPNARECNDFACVIFDEHGNALAENTLGIPSFNAIMSKTLQHFLKRFPAEEWAPGDAVITNDPWLATGHLPDISCVIPVFSDDRLVGFAGSVAHMVDIGGNVWSADTRDVYEEGLQIPPARLYRNDQPNEALFELIHSNVRLSDQVLGDVHAQISANRAAGQSLIELLREQGEPSLTAIGSSLYQRAETAMRKAIEAIPDGTYEHEVNTDGVDGHEITIRVRIDVDDTSMRVDYAGSSAQVDYAVNTVLNYTDAYTCYPIKCAIDAATPRNEGSYRPILVRAPSGSVLNPHYPVPVNGRQLVGHVLSSAVYGALVKAIPNKVIADSGSAPTLRLVLSGKKDGGARAKFTSIFFLNGGMGARPSSDGLSCTCFPSNVIAGSMEVMEAIAPLVVWKKELAQDSGGPGTYRGGLGQDVIVQVNSAGPAVLSLFVDRVSHPPLGLRGGAPGAGAVVTIDGRPPHALKGRNTIPSGAIVTARYPGGGGYGPPEHRERSAIERDLVHELISLNQAREVYGHGD